MLVVRESRQRIDNGKRDTERDADCLQERAREVEKREREREQEIKEGWGVVRDIVCKIARRDIVCKVGQVYTKYTLDTTKMKVTTGNQRERLAEKLQAIEGE